MVLAIEFAVGAMGTMGSAVWKPLIPFCVLNPGLRLVDLPFILEAFIGVDLADDEILFSLSFFGGASFVLSNALFNIWYVLFNNTL